MGLLDKFKKNLELKQNSQNPNSIKKTYEKILNLEKKLTYHFDSPSLLIDLYMCYVEVSDTKKKIECMEKLSKLQPHDSYPLQQLADIYSNDLNDVVNARYYQNKANKINKFL